MPTKIWFNGCSTITFYTHPRGFPNPNGPIACYGTNLLGLISHLTHSSSSIPQRKPFHHNPTRDTIFCILPKHRPPHIAVLTFKAWTPHRSTTDLPSSLTQQWVSHKTPAGEDVINTYTFWHCTTGGPLRGPSSQTRGFNSNHPFLRKAPTPHCKKIPSIAQQL